MFSATFPKPIQKLAEDFLSEYAFLSVGRVGSTNEFITQRVRWVEEHEKKGMLLQLLPTIEGRTLVFVETKRSADGLEEFLYHQGIQATSIHGDRSQREREAALDAFKNGSIKVLVATDVASRGLDVQGVRHVINYDMPTDIDDYVHRIGRTGRAGNDGLATSFFNDKNRNVVRDLVELLEEAGQEVETWLYELNKQAPRGVTTSGSRNGRGGSRGGAGGGYGGGYGGSSGGGFRGNAGGFSSGARSGPGFGGGSPSGGSGGRSGGGGGGGGFGGGGRSGGSTGFGGGGGSQYKGSVNEGGEGSWW